MRLSFFLMFAAILISSANVYSQSFKVSLELKNASLESVFQSIQEQTEFDFFYKNEQLPNNKIINKTYTNTRIDVILKEVLEGTGLVYRVLDKDIIVTKKNSPSNGKSNELQKSVSGIVTDSSGRVLPGATVLIKGTTQGTVTGFDGKYMLTSVPDDAIFVISFVGMLSQEIVVGSQSSINISLTADAIGIEEIVAIGYGAQKKKDLTGAIATINHKAFNKGVVVSPEQLLQGKVSGLSVTTTSGEPGAAQTITIRGPGSIRSGNSPLYVVDGVPLTNEATTSSGVNLGFGSQTSKNPMNFINPNDIESIDVLKDASAAAIYGSRGSNGVIIITTKSGIKGKAKVEYASELGVSEVARKIEVLSADEFKDYHSKSGSNKYIGNSDTNWQDEIFRTAISHNHKLSLTSANENSKHYASLSYLNQEGIITGSNLKRYTGRINSGQNLWDNKLQVNLNLTASHIRDDAVPIGDDPHDYGDLITNTLFTNPTYPVKNADGSFFDREGMLNPVAMNELYTDFSTSNRVLGSIDATLQLARRLSYKINLGIDNSMSTRNIQISKHAYTGIKVSPEGRLFVGNIESRNYLIDNIFTYDFSIQKDHSFKLMAGHSYQNFYIRYHGYGVSNFSTDEIDAIYNPAIGSTVSRSNGDWPSGGAREDELQSFLGRIFYSLTDKYIFAATVRHDGSSRFGENNKYGTFPSLSAAWRIIKEDFAANWDALYNLKIRAGWGQTGNQELPSKQTLASVTSSADGGTGYPLGQGGVLPGIRFVRNANPDLQWEVVTQTNLGIDFGFFNGDIFGSIDYFNKITTNALLQVDVVDPLGSAGGSKVWRNLKDTKIENKGWEFELGYQSTAGEFGYTFGANATILNNVIKNLQGYYRSGELNGPGLTNESVLAYVSGASVGAFFLPEFLGLNSEGQSTYRGADGDVLLGTEVTIDDYIIAGSAIPDLTYNFYANFDYANFDLSINFNGVAGNWVYNNTANAYFRRAFIDGGNNVEKKLLTDYANESKTNSDKPSTRYLEKGNFLRLNNLTLGYNWDMSRVKNIDNLRLFVTGQNLFVITNYSGYDPEVNTNKNIEGRTSYGIDMSSYPKAKTIMFGVNVLF